jgi:hypothetical protein
MGLDCSHDAFHGAYTAFNRFRQAVCFALGDGSSFPPHFRYHNDGSLMEDAQGRVLYHEDLDPNSFYWPDGYTQEAHPGLHLFLSHSDCDGEISPEMCVKVADELEQLLPKVEALGWVDGGHIERNGGYVEVLRQFIRGCRAAAAAGEALDFH